LSLSWKQKYRGLKGFATTLYKSPLKKAVSDAIEKGIIQNDDPSISLFLLRGCFFGIDKTELGDYLGENNAISQGFVRLLDWNRVHLYWALK
jgi:Sec7-like guanine-nucleotide exchange factor